MDHFARLGLPAALDLDAAALDKAYFARQRQWHPDRFVGYSAVVPMNAPEAAAREAERALENGANAVQLGTNVNGKPIDGKEFWPLYEVGTGRWHNGTDTVLIGDAAHAMMPFAAQGAAMAIEDAFELAGIVAGRPLTEALDVFERHRVPRIAHLRQRAAFNRFAYHARGPFRLGRDFVLSMRPPQSLAADLDWIYGYHAIG